MGFFQSLIFGFVLKLAGKKIVIEGDSITEGYPVSGSQRWTTLFCNELGAIEVNQGVSSKALQDGDNCTSPNFDINSIPLKDDSYGLYIMALGVNDILFFNGSFTPLLYEATLIQAMQKAKDLGWGNDEILILSPYHLKSGSGIGGFCGSAMWDSIRFNEYVLASKQAADVTGVMYLDITSVYGDSVLSLDGIHPDASGHLMIKNFLISQVFP